MYKHPFVIAISIGSLLGISAFTQGGVVPKLSDTLPECGRELYRMSCAACHGPDGRGAPVSMVGFDTPLPDFTDCNFSTREA